MTIEKINTNMPNSDRITSLNNMIVEVNGKVEQGIFNKNDIDTLYDLLGTANKYAKNISLGHTIATYTGWSHVYANDGYSIWKLAPTNYSYSTLNQLYLDDSLLENKGLATSETITAFDAVYEYDGVSAYNDHTTEAGTENGTAFSFMSTTAKYLYVGHSTTYTGISFDFSTRGSNYTLVIEYWDGAAWTALSSTTDTLVDNTSGFVSNGIVTWAAPDDWATATVNSATKYWIRFSTSTTPIITASAYKVCQTTSVVDLLNLSSTEITAEDWVWCSYNNYVYVTIRNSGGTTYEGDYYITSSSSATNLQNYFIYNHDYTLDYLLSTYDSVVTKTDDYTATGTDGIILLDEGSGGLTITLPDATTVEGNRILIKKIGDTANNTIESESGQTIDGQGSITLTNQYESVLLVSNGTNWYILGWSSIASGGGLNIPILSADPSSPTDGTIWYRSDEDEVRLRVNSTTYKLSVTPV